MLQKKAEKSAELEGNPVLVLLKAGLGLLCSHHGVGEDWGDWDDSPSFCILPYNFQNMSTNGTPLPGLSSPLPMQQMIHVASLLLLCVKLCQCSNRVKYFPRNIAQRWILSSGDIPFLPWSCCANPRRRCFTLFSSIRQSPLWFSTTQPCVVHRRNLAPKALIPLLLACSPCLLLDWCGAPWGSLQLDWPSIADGAYAGIFAVKVHFHIRDPRPVLDSSAQTTWGVYFGFLKNWKMSLFGRFWCFWRF